KKDQIKPLLAIRQESQRIAFDKRDERGNPHSLHDLLRRVGRLELEPSLCRRVVHIEQIDCGQSRWRTLNGGNSLQGQRDVHGRTADVSPDLQNGPEVEGVDQVINGSLIPLVNSPRQFGEIQDGQCFLVLVPVSRYCL